jgi:hypothetical protein
MSPFRYRDEESNAASALYVALGALAGFAAGVVVAQQYGGFSGLTSKLKDRISGFRGETSSDEEDPTEQLGAHAHDHQYDDEDDDEYTDSYDTDEDAELSPAEELEERVLEAFRNDPILSERAIDIGAIDDGIVELTGWVNADDESEKAVTVARGTPGVDTVVNRLAVRAEEDMYDDLAEDYDENDAGGQWEGQSVGTGRRRQGNSAEVDRHEDPRTPLEEKVLDKEYLDADEEAGIKAERRARPKAPRGGRTDGSAIAPSGVPKSDHVADPLNATNETAQGE